MQINFKANSEKPKIVIVIPAYNEREHLYNLFESITACVREMSDFESIILVIDDGSIDGTWELCKRIHAEEHCFTAARLVRNFGKEVAILVGLSLVESSLYAVLDADGQHNPRYLPEMLATLMTNDLDLVIGERLDYVPKNMGLATKVYYHLLRIITGKDYEKLCDFSLFTLPLRNYMLTQSPTSLVFKMLIYNSATRRVSFPLHIPEIGDRSRRWSKGRLISKGISTIYTLSALNRIVLLSLIMIAGIAIATVMIGIIVNHFILNMSIPRGYLTLIGLNIVLVVELTTFLIAYLLRERAQKLPTDLRSLVADHCGFEYDAYKH